MTHPGYPIAASTAHSNRFRGMPCGLLGPAVGNTGYFTALFVIFSDKPASLDWAVFPSEVSYRKMTLKWHLSVVSSLICELLICWYTVFIIRMAFRRFQTSPLFLQFFRGADFSVSNIKNHLHSHPPFGCRPSRGHAGRLKTCRRQPIHLWDPINRRFYGKIHLRSSCLICVRLWFIQISVCRPSFSLLSPSFSLLSPFVYYYGVHFSLLSLPRENLLSNTVVNQSFVKKLNKIRQKSWKVSTFAPAFGNGSGAPW